MTCVRTRHHRTRVVQSSSIPAEDARLRRARSCVLLAGPEAGTAYNRRTASQLERHRAVWSSCRAHHFKVVVSSSDAGGPNLLRSLCQGPGDSPPFRSRSEWQHPPRIPRLSPVPPGEESPGIGGGACQKNRLEQQSALRLRCGETCVRRAPLVPDTHFAAALSTPVLAAFDGDDDGRLLRKLDIPSNQILECRPGIALFVSVCVSVRECLWVAAAYFPSGCSAGKLGALRVTQRPTEEGVHVVVSSDLHSLE
ncbi:hypothetical protein HPB51_003342 [Rhipicephalus microplus]|uniref:Uncharacterized protein n=1 Tax=Rhipicephalus microplus TaxID=6941 RepID=A0A9J6EXA1_RHIMP|nr:hypothetical protein HPB51_003342 [Rhipicephalus microplus]